MSKMTFRSHPPIHYINNGSSRQKELTMKKLLLIVNPRAGQRKACRFLADIIDVFNRSGYTVITHITSGPGDCTSAVVLYSKEVDLIVCCGGDGTFNETIAGLLKSGANLPVGYIPAGSTNDFANSLNLSGDLVHAAYDVVSGLVVDLDIGSFNGRHFSYVASFGVFSRTSYSTPQDIKNIFGHVAYLLSGIQELSQLKSYNVRFELPDGNIIEDEFTFGAITNTTSVGGILTLSKDIVDMSDGKFELLLIRKPKDLVELRECIRALNKKTYDSKLITFLTTESVKITAPADMDWTLDGEREPGHETIEAHCCQHALKLKCRSL